MHMRKKELRNKAKDKLHVLVLIGSS